MPKRQDIKSILIIGAGLLLLDKPVSLIILEPKHVKLFEKRGIE